MVNNSTVINDMAKAVSEIGGDVFCAAWHTYERQASELIVNVFAPIATCNESIVDSFYTLKDLLLHEYCSYKVAQPPKSNNYELKYKNNIFYSSDEMINVLVRIETNKMVEQHFAYLTSTVTGISLLEAFVSVKKDINQLIVQ